MSGTYPPYPDFRRRKRTPWYSKPWFGILLGILAPIVVFVSIKESSYQHLDMKRFIENAVSYKLMATFLSQSIIINLGIFFCLLMMELDNAARGVIAATFLWGTLIVYFKFF